jgi:hypothetical protein
MNDAQIVVIVVTAILLGLIFILAHKDNNQKRKLLVEGKDIEGKYRFKNILRTYKDQYNLNINNGTLSQLKKIYVNDITKIQNDEVIFISYGIKGFSFSFWIITNENFIYFSKSEGLTLFNHSQKNNIINFLDIQKNWNNVFITYMRKAYDLFENKVYDASIEIIERKYLQYSGNENYESNETENNQIISNDSFEIKLNIIKDLLDKGYISKLEYDQKRQEILDSLI